MFRRGKTLDEQIAVEIEQEAERCKERCGELHEDFKERLRRRDAARAALTAVDEEMSELQGRAISLLGQLNTATRKGDDEKLQELEVSYAQNSRELSRVQRRREKAARGLAAAELDDEEAARELGRAAAGIVEDHAAGVRDLKKRLNDLLDSLDRQRGEVARAAAPLTEEHEQRRAADSRSSKG